MNTLPRFSGRIAGFVLVVLCLFAAVVVIFTLGPKFKSSSPQATHAHATSTSADDCPVEPCTADASPDEKAIYAMQAEDTKTILSPKSTEAQREAAKADEARLLKLLVAVNGAIHARPKVKR